MNGKLICKGRYELDVIKGEGESTIAALTEKNVRFIEAVIKLDSNYANDSVVGSKPDQKFKPEDQVEGSKYYCGSTAYWFNEMRKREKDFRECVLGAIIAIDRTNSTHLEAAKNGRTIMRDRICEKCKNVDNLIEMLNKQYKSSDTNHLVSILSEKMEAKNRANVDRFNLSFATKFCAYAAKYLDAKEYSKYDKVVADSLPRYVNAYLEEKRNKGAYKNSAKSSLEDRLKCYEKYSTDINNIIRTVKEESGTKVTLEQFDHIVWYANKG